MLMGEPMIMKKLKELLAFMEAHDLCEIEIEEEGSRIRLKKSGAGPPEVIVPTVVPVAGMVPGFQVQQPGPEEEKETPEETADVTSPMVGTFYRSAAPDTEPFVSVGDSIEKDDVVYIIEAMKVMNEIRSEVEGEVVAILVESGEAVEFGQQLMVVKPPSSSA